MKQERDTEMTNIIRFEDKTVEHCRRIAKLTDGYGSLRSDLTEEEKAEALRIGRIEFKSARAVRKR